VDGVLNAYQEKCVEVIRGLDTFHIRHIPRKENSEANALTQQASGLEIRKGMFSIKERPTLPDALVHGGKSGEGCFDRDSRQGEKRPTSSRAYDGESVMGKKMARSVEVGERLTRPENDY
jgi:hypothetical protein